MADYTLIDSDNYAAAGIETLFFPGGEPHVKLPSTLGGDVLMFMKLRTWADVGLAACAIDAVVRNRATENVEVFIPYFPGARQDRSDGYAPFTARIMSKLLADRATTWVFDLHSIATYEVGDIDRILMPRDLAVPMPTNIAGIIAPDEGATDRAVSFRDHFYPAVPLVQCSKQRNTRTGELSGYHMPPLPSPGTYLIVDDICDGGGTFNLLAHEFCWDPKGQESKLELFVSHGIFSKGLDNLSPAISRIYTTDSWCALPSNDRLTVIPLAPLFPKIMGDE